jgi:hypothetical protein
MAAGKNIVGAARTNVVLAVEIVSPAAALVVMKSRRLIFLLMKVL